MEHEKAQQRYRCSGDLPNRRAAGTAQVPGERSLRERACAEDRTDPGYHKRKDPWLRYLELQVPGQSRKLPARLRNPVQRTEVQLETREDLRVIAK